MTNIFSQQGASDDGGVSAEVDRQSAMRQAGQAATIVGPSSDSQTIVARAPAQSGNTVERPTQDSASGNLMDQARAKYPILQKQDYGYVENFKPNAGFLEHWSAGEPGSAPSADSPLDAMRPKELPLDKPGLEVRDPKTRPIDILGDITSHQLIKTDPVVKAAYEKLQESLTPKQQDLLKEQYQYAQDKEGDKRSFADWKEQSGMPGFLRGYTFQQWPKDFNDKVYTPQQRKDLDSLMAYLSAPQKQKGPSGTIIQSGNNGQ